MSPLRNPLTHPFFRLFETSGGNYVYSGGNTSTLAGTDGQARAYPMILPYGIITEVAVETSAAGAAGSLTRIGLLRDSLTRPGYPGAVFLDASTVATDTAPGLKTIAVANLACPMDLYWPIAVPQGGVTAPTYRSVSELFCPMGSYGETGFLSTKRAWIQGTVSGALGTFTSTLNSGGGAIRVLVKMA